MKINITFEVYDEFQDDDHETGVTNEGYEALMAVLMSYGDDIEISRG